LVQYCKAQGVQVENHARVTELIEGKQSGIIGARYQRLEDAVVTSVRCKIVIDVAGYAGRLFRRRISSLPQLCGWVGAANFLLEERSSSTWATGLRTRECYGVGGSNQLLGKKRDFFFVPTTTGTLVGTTYTSVDLNINFEQATDLAFNQLLDEINRARPSRPIAKSDIKHMFWGLLPAAMGVSRSASSQLLQQDLVVDGAKRFGLDGYCRVQGVKLTTAFELAARVLPIVQQYFSGDLLRGQRGRAVEASVSVPRQRAIFSTEDPQIINEILLAMTGDELRDLVQHCVRKEHALTLEDLLQRRIGLLPVEYPVEEIRRDVADQMAILFAWTKRRTAQELADANLLVTANPASKAARLAAAD